MDVTQVLVQALAAVEAAEIPNGLQQVAFAKAVDLLNSDQSTWTERRIEGSTEPPAYASPLATSVSNERFAAIAREFEIGEDLVERIFDEHGEELQFIGTLERLGTTKHAMVEGVAILLCAARLAGGYDGDGRTPDSALRAEIERHGLYDVTNYSKHIKRLRQLANPNGVGRATTYKLKYEGRMRARDLARQALGGE